MIDFGNGFVNFREKTSEVWMKKWPSSYGGDEKKGENDAPLWALSLNNTSLINN